MVLFNYCALLSGLQLPRAEGKVPAVSQLCPKLVYLAPFPVSLITYQEQYANYRSDGQCGAPVPLL